MPHELRPTDAQVIADELAAIERRARQYSEAMRDDPTDEAAADGWTEQMEAVAAMGDRLEPFVAEGPPAVTDADWTAALTPTRPHDVATEAMGWLGEAWTEHLDPDDGVRDRSEGLRLVGEAINVLRHYAAQDEG